MNIYFTYLEQRKHQQLLTQHLERFPSEFQQKIRKFRFWKDAQASLAGRLLLAEALQEVYQIPLDFAAIEYGEYGKPRLTSSDISFNISHSSNLVVCAVGEKQQLGIDVEFIKETATHEFQSQMTEREWQRIQTAENKTLAFYDYWTSKEAVLKANGKGLNLPLKSFEVSLNRRFAAAEGRSWHLQKIDLDPSYVCYLASDKPIKMSAAVKLLEF